MDVDDTLDAIRSRLSPYGISVEVLGADDRLALELSRGSTRTTFEAVVMPRPDLTALLDIARRIGAGNTLLIADHVSPRTAKTLRRAGVHYVDRSGNVMVEFGDVYVSAEGRRPDSHREASGERVPTGATNLLSPRRAQVIMALISWPTLFDQPLRAIATCAGTSVGMAQSTAALLRRMDLWRHDAPQSQDDLIDMWVAAYPEGLGRTLALRSFEGDPSAIGLSEPGVWISGEALAPNMYGQPTLTLYVEELTSEMVARNRWRVSPQPNIYVRKKFWHEPAGHDTSSLFTPPEVPPLIAYADMKSVNDPRVRVAAEEYRERHPGLAATTRW